MAAPPFLGLPASAQIPMQAVPTSVVEGPDGWIYVGELTGFPFPRGAANAYRIAPQVFASGFTNITGLAFAARGVLYVLQVGDGLAAAGGPPLLPPGKLIRVNADGSHSVVYAGLFYPGGLAIGPDGAAYVSTRHRAGCRAAGLCAGRAGAAHHTRLSRRPAGQGVAVLAAPARVRE